MIERYRFGAPYETGATVLQVPVLDTAGLNRLALSMEPLEFSLRLAPSDAVYGLGQSMRGVNKRGWHYRCDSVNQNHQTEEKVSHYGAHNFLLIAAERPFGVFVDAACAVDYDIGYTHLDRLVIRPARPDFDLYIIAGESLNDVAASFRRLIGPSYIPPKWAFGIGQSRWSYENADAVRGVVARFRENNLPLDCIYLDVDYMDRYRDFTPDEARFPDLRALTEELGAQGVRLAAIVEAGIPAEEDNPLYREAAEKGLLCLNEQGGAYETGVWLGRVCLPDVLNPEGRAWFGAQFSRLTGMGVEGFWLDMNEPAIFYAPGEKTALTEALKKMEAGTLDAMDFISFAGEVARLSDFSAEQKKLYHRVDDHLVRHDEVHNLYGGMMARGAAEALSAREPDKRYLILSRSSVIGMHRYAGIWTGDNHSWWSHLKLNIQMMPGLNLCGFLFAGADIGGFEGDTTEDLLLRWLQFGVFTPLMRNHSTMGIRFQEPYRFDNLEAFRNVMGARYRLIPYLYSEFVKAARNGGLYMRALAFDYPGDPLCAQVEDQLLVGEGLMIAPVYEQNAAGRTVYLPEDMLLIRIQGDTARTEPLPAGLRFVFMGLDEVVLFLRPGHLLPLAERALCVDQLRDDRLDVLAFGGEEIHYLLYRDDGLASDCDNPEHYTRVNWRPE